MFSNPYGKFVKIPFDKLLSKKVSCPTEDQLEDLLVAIGNEPCGEGDEYPYLRTQKEEIQEILPF